MTGVFIPRSPTPSDATGLWLGGGGFAGLRPLEPMVPLTAGHVTSVAVVGLHRSGSSCLAGVLHKLGVFMGRQLGGCEPTGGFEDLGFTRLCEAVFPFPTIERRLAVPVVARELRRWLATHRTDAGHLRGSTGGKYPHLCAMGEELVAAAGSSLRVVHIDRPLEESVASMVSRSGRARPGTFLDASPEQCEQLQCWLWTQKHRFLGRVPHLTVPYHELLADPARQVRRLQDYLGLSPTGEQRKAAVAHVRAELRRH